MDIINRHTDYTDCRPQLANNQGLRIPNVDAFLEHTHGCLHVLVSATDPTPEIFLSLVAAGCVKRQLEDARGQLCPQDLSAWHLKHRICKNCFALITVWSATGLREDMFGVVSAKAKEESADRLNTHPCAFCYKTDVRLTQFTSTHVYK